MRPQPTGSKTLPGQSTRRTRSQGSKSLPGQNLRPPRAQLPPSGDDNHGGDDPRGGNRQDSTVDPSAIAGTGDADAEDDGGVPVPEDVKITTDGEGADGRYKATTHVSDEMAQRPISQPPSDEDASHSSTESTPPPANLWDIRVSSHAQKGNQWEAIQAEPALWCLPVSAAVILNRLHKPLHATTVAQLAVDLIGGWRYRQMVAIYEAAPPKEDDLGNLMAILEDTCEDANPASAWRAHRRLFGLLENEDRTATAPSTAAAPSRATARSSASAPEKGEAPARDNEREEMKQMLKYSKHINRGIKALGPQCTEEDLSFVQIEVTALQRRLEAYCARECDGEGEEEEN